MKQVIGQIVAVIGMKVKVMVMELKIIRMLKQITTTTSTKTTPHKRRMSRTVDMHARFESW